MGWKRAAFIAALAAAEMGGKIWNPITEVQSSESWKQEEN